MLKAKQIHIHKREKANTNNARHGIIEEEAEFKDKSDTEDNGNDLRHIEEKDTPTMEENEMLDDRSDSEDQSLVESNRKMFQNVLDQKHERDKEIAKAEQET
eukprot:11227259-Heterocapsa_arctica.AAC.1